MAVMERTKSKYLEHLYGDNYIVLNNIFLHTHLANLSKEKTKQPIINYIVSDLYTHLITEVINNEFPTRQDTVRTRMANDNPKGFWTGTVIDSETKVVVVDIARAGTLPSERCFEILNQTLNPDLIRQDHIYMARKTNDKGEVTGVEWGGSKIGGDKNKAIIIIPDPMGATASSITSAIQFYKETIPGLELKFITMHLIITPEYIKRIQKEHPETKVYAIRLDRGNSSHKALKNIPGTYPEEESGLNEFDYIVPGAGGLGELMNNSYC
jgi:uracil phosphoribosyltransferase